MSVKIKLSYTDEEECREIMRLLSPVVKSWKRQTAKGYYKRAYASTTIASTTNTDTATKGKNDQANV